MEQDRGHLPPHTCHHHHPASDHNKQSSHLAHLTHFLPLAIMIMCHNPSCQADPNKHISSQIENLITVLIFQAIVEIIYKQVRVQILMIEIIRTFRRAFPRKTFNHYPV